MKSKSQFTKCPITFVKYLKGNELKVILSLISVYSYVESIGKLQDDNSFQVSADKLCNYTDLSKPTVLQAIKGLKDNNLIETKSVGFGKGKVCNYFKLLFENFENFGEVKHAEEVFSIGGEVENITTENKENKNESTMSADIDYYKELAEVENAKKAERKPYQLQLSKLVGYSKGKENLTDSEVNVLLQSVEENIKLLSDKQRKLFFVIKTKLQPKTVENKKTTSNKQEDKNNTFKRIEELIVEIKEIAQLDPRSAEYIENFRAVSFYTYDELYNIYNSTDDEVTKNKVLNYWGIIKEFFVNKDFISPINNKLIKKTVEMEVF